MRASRGEIKIEEILQSAGLSFKEEYIFDDLMSTSGKPRRFDFAVFDDKDPLNREFLRSISALTFVFSELTSLIDNVVGIYYFLLSHLKFSL